MDFSQENEIDYGRDFVPGKTDYTINYTNEHDFLTVNVENDDFDNRILKAYIPYMKSYKLYNLDRSYWLAYYSCKSCQNEPKLDFLDIYFVDSVNRAWCVGTTYNNFQKYKFMDGCPGMVGIEESRKIKGSVFITPHFHSDFQGMFTPYLKPGHSSAGS